MSRAVLVTGANSGLGFEAAAQFAHEGFTRVVLGCRSLDSAAKAQAALEARTGHRRGPGRLQDAGADHEAAHLHRPGAPTPPPHPDDDLPF